MKKTLPIILLLTFYNLASAQSNFYWYSCNAQNNCQISHDVMSINLNSNGSIWTANSGDIGFFANSSFYSLYTDYSSLNGQFPISFPWMMRSDTSDNKYVASSNGLFVLHANVTWANYTTSNSSVPINNIQWIDTKANKVYISYSSVVIFDGATFTSLPANPFWGTIAVEKNTDNIWIANNFGEGIAKYNGTSWIQYLSSNSPLPNDRINHIICDYQNNIWMSTDDSGLVKFNSGNWTRYTTANAPFATNSITNLGLGANNTLLISVGNINLSRTDVFIYDGATWTKLISLGYTPQDIIQDNNNNTLWLTDAFKLLKGEPCNSSHIPVISVTDTMLYYSQPVVKQHLYIDTTTLTEWSFTSPLTEYHIITDYGDGTIDTLLYFPAFGVNEYETHQYAEPGIYTVCTYLINNCGSSNHVCNTMWHEDVKELANEQVKISDKLNDIFIENTHNERLNIVLYEMLGQKVMSYTSTERAITISKSTLTPGIYFLTVNASGRKMVKKIIK